MSGLVVHKVAVLGYAHVVMTSVYTTFCAGSLIENRMLMMMMVMMSIGSLVLVVYIGSVIVLFFLFLVS